MRLGGPMYPKQTIKDPDCHNLLIICVTIGTKCIMGQKYNPSMHARNFETCFLLARMLQCVQFISTGVFISPYVGPRSFNVYLYVPHKRSCIAGRGFEISGKRKTSDFRCLKIGCRILLLSLEVLHA